MRLLRGLFKGAMGGAAGTTALNTSTYIDMALRGRKTSSAPEDTVEKLSAMAGARFPGDEDTRPNRVSGLGALSGVLVGVGVGAGLGAVQAVGWRPRLTTTALVTGTVAMALTDGPMVVLGVTDPRKWSAPDWLSDAQPHLAYGVVTAVVLGDRIVAYD